MKEQKRAEADQRKAAAKAKRDQERKVAELEAKIHTLEARLKELAGGRLAAAVDFVGASATARLGLDALNKGGTYVIVGLFGGDVTLPLVTMPNRSSAMACVRSRVAMCVNNVGRDT